MSASRPASGSVSGLPSSLISEILHLAETLDTVVVGGQALNIWAEHYHSRCQAEFDALAPLASKDIDFFGNRHAAEVVARHFALPLAIPDRDDLTANSALIELSINGSVYIVDFLNDVAGVDIERMPCRAVPMTVQDSRQPGTSINVRVLHPMDVLRSRIAGVLILRRSDAQSIRHLRAAPIIVREYLRDLLDRTDQDPKAIKRAQKLVEEVIEIASTPLNDAIYDKHAVDLFAPAFETVSHPAWPALFARHQIDAAVQLGRRRRDRRLAESARRRDRR